MKDFFTAMASQRMAYENLLWERKQVEYEKTHIKGVRYDGIKVDGSKQSDISDKLIAADDRITHLDQAIDDCKAELDSMGERAKQYLGAVSNSFARSLVWEMYYCGIPVKILKSDCGKSAKTIRRMRAVAFSEMERKYPSVDARRNAVDMAG